MLRSILVALDGSKMNVTAGKLALEIAHRHKAHVEGLGIVNAPLIERPEAVPLGGAAIKAASNARRLESARQRVSAMLEIFRVQGESFGVSSLHLRQADGDPNVLLQGEATAHDLIVLDRSSIFEVEADEREVSPCVDQVIRSGTRPILLVPGASEQEDEGLDAGPVLVAFDGSPTSSRTVHLFALLGIATDQPLHVLTVDHRSREHAQATAAQACSLLRRHGANQVHAIALGNNEAGTPAEAILGTAKALGARMIVMGAYGHSGIRELFGSCSREVLSACPVPLFLHH